MQYTSILYFVLLFVLSIASAGAQETLDKCLQAHGGIEKFRTYGTLEYDLIGWPSKNGKLNDRQLFDLRSRYGLITSEGYKIGFNGKEVWITPDIEALGKYPRFYLSTPFYFFVMPFVLADPGAVLTDEGTKTIDGKEYDAIKVSYEKGVGDTPEDNYVAYFDKETHMLKLLHYIVTYPPFMKGKSLDELDRHVIMYDEWQESGGLMVPKKVSFHGWDGEKPVTHGDLSVKYENVVFKEEKPVMSLFKKPEGAEVDNSHLDE